MAVDNILQFIQDFQIIISAFTGIIGVLVTILLELRKRRIEREKELERRSYQIAIDTLTIRLLPFYNQVLKLLNRLELLGISEFRVQLPSLKMDIDDLYTQTGKAFFSIDKSPQRRLVLDTLQLLDLFSNVINVSKDLRYLNNLRTDIMFHLTALRKIVEEDLKNYKILGKFPSFEELVKVDYEGICEIKYDALEEFLRVNTSE